MISFERLRNFLSSNNWRCEPGKQITNGVQILVRDNNGTAVLTYYMSSGKVVIGGPQSALRLAIEKWVDSERASGFSHDAGTTADAPGSRAVTPHSAAQEERCQVTAGSAGLDVTIEQPTWQLARQPGGFWRFSFADGGILDWYSEHNGRLDVRGRETAASYQILRQQMQRDILPPASGSDASEAQQVLERLCAMVNGLVPHRRVTIPSVQGIGWRQQDGLVSTRWDFTDGAILYFYHSTGRLLVQGTPSPLTRQGLKAIASPFYPGLGVLVSNLKKLFPDWKLGRPAQAPVGERGVTVDDSGDWWPLENALNWKDYWPAGRSVRTALRPGQPSQGEMMDAWGSVLSHHGGMTAMLAHAPTGLGKTVAALVPALAWVARAPHRRRVYYLVNRISQHDNPIRELRNGLAETFQWQTDMPLRVVDLVGRADLCLDPGTKELTQRCRRSRDEAAFNDLPGGVCDWRQVRDVLGPEHCPYHTLQGLLPKAHVVICDYWWLFSRGAQELARLAGVNKECAVIVDEAHNLAASVRSEFDVEIPLADLRELLRHLPPAVEACVTPVVQTVAAAEPEVCLLPSHLVERAGGRDTVRGALACLDERSPDAPETPAHRLLHLLLEPDENAVIYRVTDMAERENLIARMVDPTLTLRTGYSRVHASLAMSGTLAAPSDTEGELRYQVPLLGLPTNSTLVRKYATPFPPRNQQWLYAPDTLGTYRYRDQCLPRYAQHIIRAGRATSGVTAVFFSSYDFLERVLAALGDPEEQRRVVKEARSLRGTGDGPLDLSEYQTQMADAMSDAGRAYLFAVYQGRLAEGANFSGNLIRTVLCVSLPLEYPGPFHARLEARYAELLGPVAEDRRDSPVEKAREYAYNRVSLSLVLQACGRGIRSTTDRCVFLLLDQRYGPGKDAYDWRRYLEPRPFHVSRPEVHITGFHSPAAMSATGDWDVALVAVCRREEGV